MHFDTSKWNWRATYIWRPMRRFPWDRVAWPCSWLGKWMRPRHLLRSGSAPTRLWSVCLEKQNNLNYFGCKSNGMNYLFDIVQLSRMSILENRQNKYLNTIFTCNDMCIKCCILLYVINIFSVGENILLSGTYYFNFGRRVTDLRWLPEQTRQFSPAFWSPPWTTWWQLGGCWPQPDRWGWTGSPHSTSEGPRQPVGTNHAYISPPKRDVHDKKKEMESSADN